MKYEAKFSRQLYDLRYENNGLFIEKTIVHSTKSESVDKDL
jgi:hypothetical protein